MTLVMFTIYLQYLKHSCDAYKNKNNRYNFQLTAVKVIEKILTVVVTVDCTPNMTMGF